MRVLRALADENRVRILVALAGQELCVCQVVELLKLAPSTVSKHLSILRDAGLVDARKQGRWIYYRLADAEAPLEAKEALEFVLKAAARTRQAQQDAQRLRTILRVDPEELCRRQCASRK